MDLPLHSASANGSNYQKGVWSLTGPETDWQVSTPADVHNPSSKSVGGNDAAYSPDGSNLVKLVILGAPGVGKTSIIQQFVWGTFEPTYLPTGRKETYYPSVILHDHHYELKIVDIPDLPFFPVNSFYNLSDLQSYGLRDATAYILVFDLLCPESFEYVSGLYSQICEARDVENVPIIVIGNKTDKVELSLSSWRNTKKRHHHHHHCRSLDDGSIHHHHYHDHGGNDYPAEIQVHTSSPRHRHKCSSSSQNRRSCSSSRCSAKCDHLESHKRNFKHKSVDVWGKDAFFDKEIAERVVSEWKATYMECAAVDSDSVTDLFKTIMELVAESMEENDLNSKLDKKCVIL